MKYICWSASSNLTNQSWEVSTNFGAVRVEIKIPLNLKITRAKVILFIEAFHEGMRAAFDAQNIDQTYVWNKKTNFS